MKKLSDFLRVLVGYGEENLERYLRTQIRMDFYGKQYIDAMLNSLAREAEGQIGEEIGFSPQLFKEDLIDSFIDRDRGGELRAILTGLCRDHGLNKEDAWKVSYAGVLDRRLQDKVKEYKEEFQKVIFGYLKEDFRQQTHEWVRAHQQQREKEWVREHREFPGGYGKGKEEAVLDERELEERIKDEQKWEEGLIQDVLWMIDSKVDAKSRVLYKMLLKDRILSDPKKTLVEVAKALGTSKDTVDRAEERLQSLLETYLKGRGLGPKFDLSEKAIDVPSYTEFLPGRVEDIKDLQDWLKGQEGSTRQTYSDRTREALRLFTEGKRIQEIAGQLDIPRQRVTEVKNRYFDKAYDAWYRDRVEEIRQAACIRLKQRNGVKI